MKDILKAFMIALIMYVAVWGITILVFWSAINKEVIKAALISAIVILPTITLVQYLYNKK